MPFTVQNWVNNRQVGNKSLTDPPTSYDTREAFLNAVQAAMGLPREGHFIIAEIKDGKWMIQEPDQ